ncbi:MAG TPA: DUF6328 family protein [Thermomicrobiales bacterium]|nr:DUF6328 family protein [Thermomicrobiales bacterium]
MAQNQQSKNDQVKSDSDEESRKNEQDGSLSDMLNEMRVLLPGAQTLTAFMIIVPFNASFQELSTSDRWVYVITFLCSLIALLLFAAPAAHHRLERPLIDREEFKNFANRFIVAGLFFLSVALVLATELVIARVYPEDFISWGVAGLVAVLVLTVWWLMPRSRIRRLKARMASGKPNPSATKS